RTLIENIVRRVVGEGELRPELKNEVASAVAETLAQRATQTLQANLERRLIQEWAQTSRAARVNAQQQPAPGPQPAAPRPPSPTPPSAAPSPGVTWAQAPSPDPKTGAPRPPSLTPGSPAPSPSGIVPWQTSVSAVATAEDELLPAKCIVLDEFLAPAELEALMRHAQLREPQFRVSEVISPGVPGGSVDFEYRRSMVLFDLDDPGSALVERARSYLPRVLE